MVERGIMPYPMPFDQSRRDLKDFQRWAVTGLYRSFTFDKYDVRIKSKKQAHHAQTDIFANEEAA
jgi:hypothetical protein